VAESFRRLLLAWYRRHARALPWRGIRNPYGTWLSEIMLQQTRVATVVDRYVEFLQRFPTLKALAEAPEEAVLALWSGLGYYRRARMLHRGAQFVERELKGKLPRSAPALRTLPGVGEYTAAAIASIAFGESVAVLDGNVERVLLRVLGLAEDRSAKARARLNAAAQALVPAAAKRRERSNPPGDHNQAMMELGATICLPRQPLCLECPVMNFCKTRGEHAVAQRGKPQSRVAVHLLTLRKRGTTTEVLLLRRPATESLMPEMLELPPLPLEAVAGREPAIRLRHSITNTNYYVQIFAESAPGVAPLRLDEEDSGGWDEFEEAEIVAQEESESVSAPSPQLRSLSEFAGDPEFAAMEESLSVEDLAGSELDPRLTAPEGTLLGQVPANEDDMVWVAAKRLRLLPLTGLTRKALQRLGVMSVPKVKVN
jgi:A/G-specific adenine glycosylase